ncbi:MAG: hypothetical protein V7629_14175 [Motiliproteus sp.]
MSDCINWDLDVDREQPDFPMGSRYSLQQQEGEWGIFSAQEQRLSQPNDLLLSPNRLLSPQVHEIDA